LRPNVRTTNPLACQQHSSGSRKLSHPFICGWYSLILSWPLPGFCVKTLYNKAFLVSNKLSLSLSLFWTPPKQRSCGLVRRIPPLPTGVITTSEGLEFEGVTSYKYLGVWLDGTLSFSQPISKLQVKVKSRLGFLYRNHSFFITAAKLTLIQMTILPMLDYGDIIYRSAGKGALERQDVLYHSAIRFTTKASLPPIWDIYCSSHPPHTTPVLPVTFC
jgi:hypothetical protein